MCEEQQHRVCVMVGWVVGNTKNLDHTLHMDEELHGRGISEGYDTVTA